MTHSWNRAVQAVGIVVISLLWPAPARADEITLRATVRDFRASHPDMESTGGNDPGIVRTTIGMDRKPVYAGGSGTLTTHGRAAFDQWYRDVPGVNLSTEIELVLNNGRPTPGGVYTFADGSFFPIDGQLFGNEGRSHNYHFTLELHTRFTYVPGQVFTFRGDDDVFVFINDRLVIDLGGVHGAQSRSVNLDGLGLQGGMEYDFDLFFAERHTVASSFRIDTSVVFEECGNGFLDPGEDCDDGNPDSCDGCSATCEAEVGHECGDGVVNQDCAETCDDGNSSNDDDCLNDCTAATCGDGFVRAGVEACDDGNTDPSDRCDTQGNNPNSAGACTLTFCGDGTVQDPNGQGTGGPTGTGDEQCDFEGELCNENCVIRFCGDGVLDLDLGEQCDDGNMQSDDCCSSTCLLERVDPCEFIMCPDLFEDPVECEDEDSCDILDQQDECPLDAVVDEDVITAVFPDSFCGGDEMHVSHVRRGSFTQTTTSTSEVCNSECQETCFDNCIRIPLQKCYNECVLRCSNGVCIDWDTVCNVIGQQVFCDESCFTECELNFNEETQESSFTRPCGLEIDDTLETRQASGTCTGELVGSSAVKGWGTASINIPLPLLPGDYELCLEGQIVESYTVVDCGPACRIEVSQNAFALDQGVDALLPVAIETSAAGGTYMISLDRFDDDSHTMTLPLPPFLSTPGTIETGADTLTPFDLTATNPQPDGTQTHWGNVVIRAEGTAVCEATFDVDVLTVCGNGTIEPEEECDDGNNVDGDGCSTSCIVENGPSLPTLTSIATCAVSSGPTELCFDFMQGADDGAPAGPDEIVAISWCVTWDSDELLFDCSDDNADTIPDDVSFFVGAVFDTVVDCTPTDPDCPLRFSIVDVSRPLMPVPNGRLACAALSVPPTAPDGPVSVSLVDVSSSDTGGTSIPVVVDEQPLVVDDCCVGDCNDDGVVDVADAVSVVLELSDNDGSDFCDTKEVVPFDGVPCCDCNTDTVIDIADAVCVVNGIGNLHCPALAHGAAEQFTILSPATDGGPDIGESSTKSTDRQRVNARRRAGLTLYRERLDQRVIVPVSLTQGPDDGQPGGRDELTAFSVCVDFDQDHLDLDETDRDHDGIPDAVSISLPASHSPFVLVDLNRSDCELHLGVIDLSAPSAPLPDGVVAEIEFRHLGVSRSRAFGCVQAMPSRCRFRMFWA